MLRALLCSSLVTVVAGGGHGHGGRGSAADVANIRKMADEIIVHGHGPKIAAAVPSVEHVDRLLNIKLSQNAMSVGATQEASAARGAYTTPFCGQTVSCPAFSITTCPNILLTTAMTRGGRHGLTADLLQNLTSAGGNYPIPSFDMDTGKFYSLFMIDLFSSNPKWAPLGAMQFHWAVFNMQTANANGEAVLTSQNTGYGPPLNPFMDHPNYYTFFLYEHDIATDPSTIFGPTFDAGAFTKVDAGTGPPEGSVLNAAGLLATGVNAKLVGVHWWRVLGSVYSRAGFLHNFPETVIGMMENTMQIFPVCPATGDADGGDSDGDSDSDSAGDSDGDSSGDAATRTNPVVGSHPTCWAPAAGMPLLATGDGDGAGNCASCGPVNIGNVALGPPEAPTAGSSTPSCNSCRDFEHGLPLTTCQTQGVAGTTWCPMTGNDLGTPNPCPAADGDDGADGDGTTRAPVDPHAGHDHGTTAHDGHDHGMDMLTNLLNGTILRSAANANRFSPITALVLGFISVFAMTY